MPIAQTATNQPVVAKTYLWSMAMEILVSGRGNNDYVPRMKILLTVLSDVMYWMYYYLAKRV